MRLGRAKARGAYGETVAELPPKGVRNGSLIG
jgi:hypothetical protein